MIIEITDSTVDPNNYEYANVVDAIISSIEFVN